MLYVALGDSTAEAREGGGYPERLARMLRAAHPALELKNLCEKGATSADVLADQLPAALRMRPGLITLGVGMHDLGLQVPDDAFAINLEEIVGPLSKLGAPLALANIPDLALAPALLGLVPRAWYEQRIEMFNLHVTATAARHRIALIDLYAISRELAPGLFAPDGFHPSGQGYQAWAARMLPALEPLLRAEARP